MVFLIKLCNDPVSLSDCQFDGSTFAVEKLLANFSCLRRIFKKKDVTLHVDESSSMSARSTFFCFLCEADIDLSTFFFFCRRARQGDRSRQ